MSQATEILGARVAPHMRVVGAVSAAHFVSHYYISATGAAVALRARRLSA